MEISRFANSDEYIKVRFSYFDRWYQDKSRLMKKLFLTSRSVTVLGSALIPAIAGLEWLSAPYGNMAVSGIGILVVVLVSLDSVFRWGERWRSYRATQQLLGREKAFFMARRGPYSGQSDEDAFGLLVERCEEAIAVETTATLNVLSVQQNQPNEARQT